jgi:hypothetical protein
MTKSNPFYALSACAMLLGCWLLSEALHLEAGHLGGLLVLMLVLQLYEGLLVGLGAYLVRSGRARRDGLVVLLIESFFLMDATLLSAECVTADLKAGTAVAAGLGVLAVLKLAWVRGAAPALLSRKAAVVLGAHAAFILAVPVLAAQLAAWRLLSPLVLYGFWWVTAALPAAQRMLQHEAEGSGRAVSEWPAVWAWMPTILVALHLWTVGYIHTIDFRLAFVAPFLLGLTATLRREAFLQQLILPGVAALVSPESANLAFNLLGSSVAVSPRVLAVAGACVVWTWLAWRYRNRWLAILGGSIASVGVFGLVALDVLKALLQYLDRAIPRDIFGWGTLVVIVSFVLLAMGFRRSLSGDSK